MSKRAGFIVLRCVAAGCAVAATARHPITFYVSVRWVVFLTACLGVFLARRRLWPSFAPLYIATAVIFNPLIPFHFARATWHNLDFAAAVLLAASILFDAHAQ